MNDDVSHRGSCLCGAVTFTISGALHPPDACHCTACRKSSGHFWASTDVPLARFSMTSEGNVKWFQSSPRIRRGFCGTCGATLFWQPIDKPVIAVAMGAFDPPTGTALAMNIFVDEQGDYYAITDDLPQHTG